MWVKKFADGTEISEDVQAGKTWTKTPQDNILEVYMKRGLEKSPALFGYSAYWHSRQSVTLDDGNQIDLLERLQGLRDDGRWDTLTWDENGCITSSIEERAFGKPIYN